MTSASKPLQLGILGAARIVPNAIISPSRALSGIEVAAIAARDPVRARSLAQQHGIPRVHSTYAELIADPDIDAIYNPLPNSHHAEWSIRALEAGKHVLCEKPFASNSDEAVAMAEAAQCSGKVLMEAFHYRYHPLTLRAMEIIQSGVLGTIRHIETSMCIPNWRPWDIRWRYDLAGGALMDVGCYTIHLLRTLAGSEPVVTRAHASLHSAQVDRAVKADFLFDGGMTGHIHCSMWSPTLLKLGAKVIGDNGQMTIRNPFVPQLYNRLTLRTQDGVRHEQAERIPTYHYQMRVFLDAVRNQTPFATNPNDAIANMRVIDSVYRAAGLSPRGSS
jgi:predicted dehydrogenase